MTQQTEVETGIVVDVSLKPDDIYTPFQWDRNNVARWVAAALLCWIFLDIYRTGLDALRSFQGGNSIIAIVVVLAVFVLCALLLFPYLRVRAWFRSSPAWKEPIQYVFNKNGVQYKSADWNGMAQWSAFDNVIETRKVFVLSHIYVPKRCFASIDEVRRVRQLIHENCKGKKHLRAD